MKRRLIRIPGSRVTPFGPRPAAASRRQPLPAGQLREQALAHLRAHPHLDFSPGEIANALNRPKSRTAIANACRRLVEHGQAVRTQLVPQRYQATPPPGPGDAPADRR